MAGATVDGIRDQRVDLPRDRVVPFGCKLNRTKLIEIAAFG
jgi:hypothetical protein